MRRLSQIRVSSLKENDIGDLLLEQVQGSDLQI